MMKPFESANVKMLPVANWKLGLATLAALATFLTAFARGGDSDGGILAFAYQGLLRDAQGKALAEKSHTIEFRLYDQAAGGVPCWGRRHGVTLDDEGNFAVEISDAAGEAIAGVADTGLAEVLARVSASTLYIGLSVDGEAAEISPRQKILSTPAATYAADANRAKGDMAVNGSVTAGDAQTTSAVDARSFAADGGVSAGSFTTMSDATIEGDLDVTGSISGNGAIPVGGIIPWYGQESGVPNGWAVCNGQNGTPDLRSRFIVAAGSGYTIGGTGGEESHKLTVGEMPSHLHSYKFKGADIDDNWKSKNNLYAVSHTYTWNTAYTDYVGGDQPHENRPPYYALIYIMRIQ